MAGDGVMIFQRTQEGWEKTKISWCVFPCFTDEHVFWLERVKKIYRLERNNATAEGYHWELKEVELWPAR